MAYGLMADMNTATNAATAANLIATPGKADWSKLTKAENLGVPVMDESAFVEFLGTHGLE